MADFTFVRAKLVSPFLDSTDCQLTMNRDCPSVIKSNFSDTEIKVAECQFYLNLIEQNANHQAVMYFGLSAFLAAARSATLFLQAEGKESEGFQEWYPSVRERLKDDDVAKFLKSLRDEALHVRYSEIKTVFDLPLYKTANGLVYDAAGEVHFGFSFSKYLFENGLGKCRAFVDTLRGIVEEATSRGFLPSETRRNVTLECRDLGKSRKFAPVAVEQSEERSQLPE